MMKVKIELNGEGDRWQVTETTMYEEPIKESKRWTMLGTCTAEKSPDTFSVPHADSASFSATRQVTTPLVAQRSGWCAAIAPRGWFG